MSGPRRSVKVDVTVEVRAETAAAILVHDGAVEAWVPRSLAEILPADDPRCVVLRLPEWKAMQLGLF